MIVQIDPEAPKNAHTHRMYTTQIVLNEDVTSLCTSSRQILRISVAVALQSHILKNKCALQQNEPMR